MHPHKIMLGSGVTLTLSDMKAFINSSNTSVALNDAPGSRDALLASRTMLERLTESGEPIYGVTTGFGFSSHNRFDPSFSETLQASLVRYHGCGVGTPLSAEQSLTAVLLRAHCLGLGASAVSLELMEQFVSLLNHRIAPVIPSQGSVGASGDLTPLSYVAAVLQGERSVWDEGKIKPTAEIFSRLGIKPYTFKTKEALSLMNGTSVMTAVASLAWLEVEKIAHLACRLAGLMVELLQGSASPFVPELHHFKPHQGQGTAAALICEHLHSPYKRLRDGAAHSIRYHTFEGIQDVYSLRCSPQVIGVLFDTLTWSRNWIETEINSVSDNPIIAATNDIILNGGHFYGGHIAGACDALKATLCHVTNLLDRQAALLMSPRIATFLSENLVPRDRLGAAAPINHGMKAVQISISALAAEIQKNSVPAGVLSRPTESGNQDVVSMGSIAATDLQRVVDMSYDLVTLLAMIVRQGFFIAGEKKYSIPLTSKAQDFLNLLTTTMEPVTFDRALDADLPALKNALKEQTV